MVYPMIAPLKESSFLRGRSKELFVSVAKVVIVIAALFCAWRVEQLGLVNVINGAMSAGIFVALVPSVIGILLLEAGPCYRVALLILLVGGLGVSGCGFIFNDNYVGDLKCAIKVTG